MPLCLSSHGAVNALRRLARPGRLNNPKPVCPHSTLPSSSLQESCLKPDRIPSSDVIVAPDPYKYTSGRWLDKEPSRMNSRHIQFDFSALLDVALKAIPDAQSVLRYEKLEGGFNRAFILNLDNGSRVVAKIPFRNAGPQRLATNSEVATLFYLREHSTVPVPAVLDWSDNPNNPVGSEYVIMEHVAGVQLVKAWPKMDPIQHFDCIRGLAGYMRAMTKLSFPAYGSIYFDTAPLQASQKIPLKEGFCIGPVTSPEYWPGAPEEERFYSKRPLNHGPWKDLESYSKGFIDCGYSLIPDTDPSGQLEYRGTVSEHIELLEQSRKILSQLVNYSPIIEISTPTLVHHDYHRRNIFVSESNPTQVTAIIDWQFTAVSPIFRYASLDPDFLIPHDRIENLVTSELGDSATDEERSERVRKIAGRFELLQKGFAGATRGWMPQLWKAMTTDPVLLRFLDYCDSSWRHSATALRGELIDLSVKWNYFGISEACPYQPGEVEIRRHRELEKDLNEAMKLKAGLLEIIGCDSDGWVPSEHFDTAREICHDGYMQGMKAASDDVDPNMNAEKFSKLWPFDAR